MFLIEPSTIHFLLRRVGASLLALAFSTSLTATALAEDVSGDIVAGQQAYDDKQCAACHGAKPKAASATVMQKRYRDDAPKAFTAVYDAPSHSDAIKSGKLNSDEMKRIALWLAFGELRSGKSGDEATRKAADAKRPATRPAAAVVLAAAAPAAGGAGAKLAAGVSRETRAANEAAAQKEAEVRAAEDAAQKEAELRAAAEAEERAQRAADAQRLADAKARWAQAAGGKPVPDIMGRIMGEGRFRLSKLRGTPVVLNFFWVNCIPCQAEMPELAALEKQYPKVRFVSVHVEGDPDDAVTAFVAKLTAAPSTIVFANRRVQDNYKTKGLPETHLLDKNGVAVDTLSGHTELNMKTLSDWLSTRQ